MKRSKYLFSLAIALSVFGYSALYAQAKDPATRAKELTDKMKTSLSLTDEQYSKVEAINLDFATAASALRKSNEAARNEKFNAYKDLSKKRKESLKSVLTEEQLKTMEAQQKEHRDKMKDKRKGNGKGKFKGHGKYKK